MASVLTLDQQSVRDGDQVRATGHVVSVPGEPVRFCADGLVHASATLGRPPAPTFCENGVDVDGVDLNALSSPRTQDGATEGGATLEGTWRHGALLVRQQRAPDPPSFRADADQVPCPRPAGGWPASDTVPERAGNLPEPGVFAFYDWLDATPGAGSRSMLLHPAPGKAVLAIGADSAAERVDAERSLRPALGDALCIVDTATDHVRLAAARADNRLTGAPGVWKFGPSLGEKLEQRLSLGVLLITPELREVADRYPAGLVDFEPTISRIG